MTAVSALEEHTAEFQVDIDMVPPNVRLGPDVDEAYTERAKQLAAEVKAVWLRVALIGPERVTDEAAATESACSSLAGRVELLMYRNAIPQSQVRPQACDSYRRLRKSLREFMRVARAALEDDGTEGNDWAHSYSYR
ncbi:hypothetical protein [Streptomyces geranii]|uniref:hypothetical protein n=1 Tax=Streptomyces geranii TaxID=2058923 RepID=UPI001300B72F|nr:hypothetical protein [Streptomyces geranii]